MGKGIACIGVLCVGTCTMFVTMCYLMTTVDPPPIERLHVEKAAFSNVKFDTPPATVEYGLERADLRNLGYPTYRPSQNYPNENFNVMWQYTPRKPVGMWPTTTDFVEQPIRTNPTPELKVLNKTEEVDRETTGSYVDSVDVNDTLSLIPVKRSVKELRNHGNDLNSIFLKIANESNQIVIQIKIGPNDEPEKKITGDKSPKRKGKFSMSLKTNNNDELERSELARNTVINILKNESLIIHEYDDRMSAYNSLKNVSTTVEVNEKITAVTTLANQNNSRKYENSSKIENVTHKSDRHGKNNNTLTRADDKNKSNQNITVSKHDLIANLTKLLENITSVTPTNKVIISKPVQNRMKSIQIPKPRTNRIDKVTENKIKMKSNITTVKTTASSTKHTTKATLLTIAKYRARVQNNATTVSV